MSMSLVGGSSVAIGCPREIAHHCFQKAKGWDVDVLDGWTVVPWMVGMRHKHCYSSVHVMIAARRSVTDPARKMDESHQRVGSHRSQHWDQSQNHPAVVQTAGERAESEICMAASITISSHIHPGSAVVRLKLHRSHE